MARMLLKPVMVFSRGLERPERYDRFTGGSEHANQVGQSVNTEFIHNMPWRITVELLNGTHMYQTNTRLPLSIGLRFALPKANSPSCSRRGNCA